MKPVKKKIEGLFKKDKCLCDRGGVCLFHAKDEQIMQWCVLQTKPPKTLLEESEAGNE